jgi:hypothetical protein
VSNEALCILTGLIPIDIKIAETFQFYHFTKSNKKEEALVDCDMEVKYWQHPAETITFLTGNNEETSTIQIFTDGCKSEQRGRRRRNHIQIRYTYYKSTIQVKQKKHQQPS